MLRAPAGDGLRARRDRALLALLVGCGLRRSEVAALEIDRIQQREGRWVLVDLEGKRSRTRSVPMPAWAKAAIDAWTVAAGIDGGRLFRALSQRGEVGEALTAQAVYLIVSDAPIHSFSSSRATTSAAHLAYRGPISLSRNEIIAWHATILRTERYLGVRQNLYRCAL